jgi:predicted anti-sigma-YlaC factor YlaD
MTTLNDLTCRELVDAITAYLEGALPEHERHLFEAHLQVCQGCREYLSQMQTTIGALRIMCNEETQPRREELVHLFREWKRERA